MFGIVGRMGCCLGRAVWRKTGALSKWWPGEYWKGGEIRMGYKGERREQVNLADLLRTVRAIQKSLASSG